MTSYTYRIIDCPDCWEGRYDKPEGPGYVSCECETCEGRGELDASCADCSVITALNDDGVCERCHDANTLQLADFNEKYGLTKCLGDPLLHRRAA